ncbi:MAG: diaminopimelate epimerase [Burkholderiales bacterium]|nr:diaminopimelate epimerase [Burkholderiales bacterium]
MRLEFTKMQGAGNDFVVLDGMAAPVQLGPEQARRIADRRFGVGADQILVVEPGSAPGIDFGYRIFNSSGDEVEHCGNGARCFLRYVRARGYTDKQAVRVQTVNNVLELREQPDGRVTVDMNRPLFEHERIPFDAGGLVPRRVGGFELWPVEAGPGVELAVLSMGNPHAVMRVDDVARAPVAELGPRIESHARFARRVNAGFLEVLSPREVNLRVYERGAGETLACGTGACAAVVAGIRLGWLERRVDVHTRGGELAIEWPADDASVLMTGPAEFVFEGAIEL